MSKLQNIVYDFQSLDHLTQRGIYSIEHIQKPNIIYIGSAGRIKGLKKCDIGFYRRFLEHLHALEHNNHSSKFLQNVVNKYGIQGIRFKVLEIISKPGKDFILEREQYYLDTLKPQYNSSKTARCPTVPLTLEQRKRKSNLMKGKALAQEVYDKMKVPVFQFKKTGELIESFSSIKEASTKTKIDRGSISNAASGKRAGAGGYLWSFQNTVTVVKKEKIHKHSLTGEFICSYNTISEILIELNLKSSTSIRECINGKNKKAYGFIWKKY